SGGDASSRNFRAARIAMMVVTTHPHRYRSTRSIAPGPLASYDSVCEVAYFNVNISCGIYVGSSWPVHFVSPVIVDEHCGQLTLFPVDRHLAGKSVVFL